jgi:hypothetical protein
VPSVISDPSLQPGIVSQGVSVFDYPDTPAPSILNFQSVPSQPQPDRTDTATGLLCPDLLISERLVNFPPEVYSLAPSSLLIHFMQALMGPAGAGQLRMRQQFARLQSALTSTSFYDLDSFYGALFSALRGPAGALPVDPATGSTFSPYTSLATSDGWDDIYTQDAAFRERIIQLARAITLGGTIPGLQAIAEAVTGAPCDVYQVWSLIDSQGPQGAAGNTWNQLQAMFPTWNAAVGESWNQVQGVVLYGGMGINARNEVIIQPKRIYPPTQTGAMQQAADMWGILRITEVLAPKSVIVSVSPGPLVADIAVTIAHLWADSEYWEITPKVTPQQPSDPAYQVMRLSYQHGGQFVKADVAIPQASPPYSQSQGTQYSYVADVSKVTSQDDIDQQFNIPRVSPNNETTVFPDGSTVEWKASWALLDPVRAASARTASPVAVTAAPYAGPRVPVVAAG